MELARDPSVVLFGLDVDDHKGINGSTLGLAEEFGADRVFGTPLSEDAMTGMAIGAAIAGMRPVHVHIRMDFLMLCMNQLVNMAAKARYMWGGQVSVPLVVRTLIGKSWGQGPQHSQALHSMFMHVPGLKVVAPSNAHDAKWCLAAAIRDDNPVIFVEHRLLYPTEAYVATDAPPLRLGQSRRLCSGEDITLVGISAMVPACEHARNLLAEVDISAEVVDPISLVPLDIESIVESVKKTGRLLVVDNGWACCGASAEIIARVAERDDLPGGAILRRMTFAPTTCPTTPVLEQSFYPNAKTIAEKVYSIMRPGGPRWTVDEEHALTVHERAFRGPF